LKVCKKFENIIIEHDIALIKINKFEKSVQTFYISIFLLFYLMVLIFRNEYLIGLMTNLFK
jgi:hypothetical protein